MSAPSPFVPPRCGAPQPLWEAQAQLGEGLCWSPGRQSIYWVDIFGQRLMRLHLESGRREHWDFDETISAVAERAEGPGLIVSLQHRVAFFDPETGRLDVLHEVEPDLPGNRFNDGKCDAQGRFWVGSMDRACTAPTGSLYVVDRDGIRRAWAPGFPVVNGPTWSADGRTIYVNDTARNYPHAARFDPATGTLSDPWVWRRLDQDDGYPDGMTTDRDGRLWIAHWAGACVTCHAPDDGRELARIALPTSNITNVCFGGPDLRTLFITSATAELAAPEAMAGTLFRVETDAVGVAPHRYAG